MARDSAFEAENGAAALGRHFTHVEMRDASATVTIDDREAIVRYVASMQTWSHLADRVPKAFEPFAARRSNVVFVAETSSARRS